MPKITKIDANNSSFKRKKRIAAYARVSSATDEQEESLNAQKKHYEEFLKSNTEFEYAGLFFDDGITGTKVAKRDGILKLLKKCEEGKIDRIITKSISRFARNNEECLTMVRRLSALGVSIYFEKEKIDTAHMDSEMLLAVLSSMAEFESRSISKNIKWSIHHKFLEGTYIISTPAYGYKNNSEKKIEIVEEEAIIVKKIFNLCNCGYGFRAIAKKLNEENIKAIKTDKWSDKTIRGILENEFYTGIVIFQKTYADEEFNQKTNHGEKDKYVINNHHPAIIDEKTFNKAQDLIKFRMKAVGNYKGNEKCDNRYVFSGKIICEECGHKFKRFKTTISGKTVVGWRCREHFENKNLCSMKSIKDEAIKDTYLLMLRKLRFASKEVIGYYKESLIKTNKANESIEAKRLEKLLIENEKKKLRLQDLFSKGLLEPHIYQQEKNTCLKDLKEIQKEINALNTNDTRNEYEIEECDKLLKFLNSKEKFDSFKDEFFSGYAESITVKQRDLIEINLKCGLKLKERIDMPW